MALSFDSVSSSLLERVLISLLRTEAFESPASVLCLIFKNAASLEATSYSFILSFC